MSVELLAPDFVWDMATFAGWPDEPEYAGTHGLREFLTLWREPWDDWTMQLEEVQYATMGEALTAAGLSA